MSRPIIIDTDPGTDDAVAILLALAAPELEVLSLIAVAGNPLVDPGEMEKVKFVMKGGLVAKNELGAQPSTQ